MRHVRHGLAILAIVSASGIASYSQQSGVPLALSERPGGDGVQGSVADGSGGLWVVGWTTTPIAVTPDALQRLPAGSRDAFISHIAADGRLVYATYFGGTGVDEAYDVARDPAGNLYIAGGTNSTDFPNTTGAVRSGSSGTWDAFVVKLDPTGRQIRYSTYFGGTGSDVASGIAVDAGGSAHVVGQTPGHGFPITWNRCLDLWLNAFYARLSPDGTTVQSATCLDDSRAAAVALDANGDPYVVGLAGRNFGPRTGTVIIKAAYPTGAASQAFLAKFSGDSIEFSTYLGGSRDDRANDVAVTTKGIYVAGSGTSTDYAGAPPRTPASGSDGTGWITKVRLDGVAILGTTLLDGSGNADDVRSLEVDETEVVHATGWTNSPDFPVSPDAAQHASGGTFDAFYATIWAPQNTIGDPSYVSYLGGSNEDRPYTLALDGSGGAWLAGDTLSPDFPLVNATVNSPGRSFVARFGQPRNPPQAAGGDIVLYARDASPTVGEWQHVSDASAAGGSRVWNPDAGAPKITVPAAAPANYFELTFQATAGVPYHLWLRMKADQDHWANDSVWVQFSDSVDASGNPLWQTGTASATSVSLEDCTNCGEQGWGWNDNGYGAAGVPVRFATTGTHTIRIQQREDGISIDQIVLSSGQWASAAPGANKNDATILAASGVREIVLYAASDRSAGGTSWESIGDATAAGGAYLYNADQGQPKLSSPTAAGSDYFDVPFTAQAGVPYHLWIRSRAANDFWMNDSVFVQFSDSVDGSGAPTFRIGSGSATVVSLEDCSGCGEQGWGWNDNGYGYLAEPIYFATSGPQTIRVLRREDGIAIDQIVLSAGRFLTSAPGAAKNDTTIVPK